MARQPQCYTVPMSLQIHSPAAVKNYVERSLEDIERIYVAARVEGSMPIPAARVAGYKDAEQAAMLLEDDHRIRTAIEATFRLKIHETQIKKADVINGMKDAIMQAESAGELRGAVDTGGDPIDAFWAVFGGAPAGTQCSAQGSIPWTSADAGNTGTFVNLDRNTGSLSEPESGLVCAEEKWVACCSR